VGGDRMGMAPERGQAGRPAPPEEWQVRPGDRLLVVAAHPDDDVLATGGLLQRAAAAGATFAVVFATDGENNPWAQRASERRLLVGAADRPRFGVRRRGEALAALARLGVGGERARFLGLPDQGLTRLLVETPAQPLAALQEMLQATRPSVLVGPSAADLHPDHSALAVLLRLALAGLPTASSPRELAYVVHNPALRHPASVVSSLPLDDTERRRKHEAIACHATQLHLRGPWLRSFAAGPEELVEVPWPAVAPHPVIAARTTARELLVTVATRPRPRSFGARTLLVLADAGGGRIRRLSCPLPSLPGPLALTDPSTRLDLSRGRFVGGPFAGELRLPADLLSGSRRLFLKLERRFGFFDEAGWLEVPCPLPHPG